MQGNSWLAERLLAFQERLSSLKLISLKYIITTWRPRHPFSLIWAFKSWCERKSKRYILSCSNSLTYPVVRCDRYIMRMDTASSVSCECSLVIINRYSLSLNSMSELRSRFFCPLDHRKIHKRLNAVLNRQLLWHGCEIGQSNIWGLAFDCVQVLQDRPEYSCNLFQLFLLSDLFLPKDLKSTGINSNYALFVIVHYICKPSTYKIKALRLWPQRCNIAKRSRWYNSFPRVQSNSCKIPNRGSGCSLYRTLSR
jgi:hypothetical protein